MTGFEDAKQDHLDAAQRETFVSELSQIVEDLVTDEERRRVYETDGLTAKRALPWLVALPRTTEQVRAIMKLCYSYGVPVVARGAGTGLSGGAMPHAEGVLLSLARFNKILSVDAANRTARVQSGVTNLSISEEVSALGLYYAPDPSSQIACTIGGNVAENSGGVHCLKYGLTVHNVLQLKLVSPQGELYTVGSEAIEGTGYDLLALMNGSEGMLGIVLEVTVRLLRVPEQTGLLLASFGSVRAAGDAVGRIISAGIIPAGLEMMDRLAIQAAEDFVHVGYPRDAEAILLCEIDGNASEVADHIASAKAVLESAGALSIVVADSEAQRLDFWKGRKSAFPAIGRISPDYYCMDGTIPRRHLGDVLDEIATMSARYGLRVANVFHAGDGNLHPLILYDANAPDQLEKAEAFGGEILELCVAWGGTITGEHGVGVEKINEMCVQFSDEELLQFHALKHAFDPKGILNPGKAIPTLNRCAEFGAMHVRRGSVRFPDLDRF